MPKARSDRSRFVREENKSGWRGTPQDTSFKCMHCGYYIPTDTTISGVQNRNHCPYCLWSQHMDLNEAGDRLAGCGGGMKPVGLTLKKIKKKYGSQQGELMLIHLCTECGKVSINRIAADDDAKKIFAVYQSSLEMDADLKARLDADGITPLGSADVVIVRMRLYGRG